MMSARIEFDTCAERDAMSDATVRLGIVMVIGLGLGMPTVAGQDAEKVGPPPRAKVLRVMIVTGGHDFEREPFFEVFKGHPDITSFEVKQPEAQAWFAPDKADAYDVMVWYDMFGEIGEEAKANLVKLLGRGKPLVAVHHCLATYPKWAETEKIIGGRYVLEPEGDPPGSTFKHDQTLAVKIANREHPITRFMKDFTIVDEPYGRLKIAPDVTPLLKTDHPEGSGLLAWTHRYKNSPVVYIQLGHDSKAYNDASFRLLVAQSIRWAAGMLPEPSEEGFVELFNGKNLEGWTVVGDPAGFFVKDGVLRSEKPYAGQWLRSSRVYGDFVLRVDWRVSAEGNSGVFVRAKADGYPWETGSEIQISSIERDAAHCTGSLYGSVAVDPRPDEAPGEWRRFEVHCVGPRYKVFVDNVPVIDVDAAHVPPLGARPRAGYVGVQDNHSEKGWIEYRSIRIKELPMAGGWRLGTQAYTFNRYSFFEAVDKAKALGLKWIEAYPGQRLDASAEVKFGHDMPVEAMEQAKRKLAEAGVTLVNFGVVRLSADEAETRKVFDFARAMGIETITAEPDPKAFDLLDTLTEEYQVNVAIHNHPKPSHYWNPDVVLEAVKGRGKRIGACADTGHWMRSGLDPVECLRKLEGRIISLHFKDLNVASMAGHDVPWGTGAGHVKAMLAELKRQGFEGVFSVEYEHNWESSMPEIAKCVEYFHEVAKELGVEVR